MDFSHIVQFPTADSHESHHLLKIDPKWHPVLYNQAEKLQRLEKANTKETVYVIGREMGSHPISKDDNVDKMEIAEGTWDGLYSEDIIRIAQNIPITLITSSANCKEEWDKVCAKLGVANPIKDYIFIPWCLHFIKKFFTDGFNITKDCSKLFVYLNRRLNRNKVMLRHAIEKADLMKYCHYSWLDADSTLQFFKNTFNPSWDLMQKVELDDDAGGEMSTLPQPWYDDAYIDLASESLTHGNCLDFSEKTFKPMLRGKPGLQFNVYGHYHKLEQMGFKLYHDMFDYDIIEVPNTTQRLKGITDNLTRLAQLSQTEMNLLVDKINNNLIHNRQLIYDYAFPNINQPVNLLLDHNIIPVDMYSNWKWREHYFGQEKSIDTSLIKL